MVLILHIIIALSSLILGGLALTRGSRSLLNLQIGSFGLTLLSGIALVIQHPATLAHLCVSGVIFSVISIAMMLASRRQLQQRLRLQA